MRRFVVFVVIFAILIAVAVIKIKQKKKELAKASSPKKYLFLKTVIAKNRKMPVKREFVGTIYPDVSVDVSTKISGFIEKIFVSENSVVRKGELLVKIDDKDIRLQISNNSFLKDSLFLQKASVKYELEGAIAKLEYLKNKFKRDEALFNKKAISKQSFELSKSEYLFQKSKVDALRSSLKSIEKRIKSISSKIASYKHILNYTIIRSPIDGVITRVFLKEGSFVSPGKVILNMQSTENYKVIVNIPVELSSRIKPGEKAEVVFEKEKVEAKVEKIYRKSMQNSLIPVEIRVKKLPENIPTYSYVNVIFWLGEVSGIYLPREAVVENTKGCFVLVKRGENFVKIPVKVIYEGMDFYLVKGSLKEGEKVLEGWKGF